MERLDLQALVGAKLRKVRKMRGLSQSEAAARAGNGVSDTYWGSVERGTRNVSLKSLDKLAKAVDVEAWELFRFEDIDIDSEMNEKMQVAEIAKSLLVSRNLIEAKMSVDILNKVFNTFDSQRSSTK